MAEPVWNKVNKRQELFHGVTAKHMRSTTLIPMRLAAVAGLDGSSNFLDHKMIELASIKEELFGVG